MVYALGQQSASAKKGHYKHSRKHQFTSAAANTITSAAASTSSLPSEERALQRCAKNMVATLCAATVVEASMGVVG